MTSIDVEADPRASSAMPAVDRHIVRAFSGGPVSYSLEGTPSGDLLRLTTPGAVRPAFIAGESDNAAFQVVFTGTGANPVQCRSGRTPRLASMPAG
ncbi:hypothetical protein G7043_38130 [Lentzea sp. NEAU-D13]|uniref:Uncharacterized protein n=1 Tax=Lentzea alba TaxID=2714351 RepID=A0A7C9RWP4_9PSEU|nr:hypothetical protein [Lentzea alba]NGY64747.1 hypothetical protein [Lentzea alba]